MERQNVRLVVFCTDDGFGWWVYKIVELVPNIRADGKFDAKTQRAFTDVLGIVMRNPGKFKLEVHALPEGRESEGEILEGGWPEHLLVHNWG